MTGTGFLSLTWRILEDDGTLFGNTVPYTSSGNGASNTIGGVFAVEQLEGSPLVSNISFTVQSSINGYTIVCEDSTNTMNNESFTINVSGMTSRSRVRYCFHPHNDNYYFHNKYCMIDTEHCFLFTIILVTKNRSSMLTSL